MRLTTSARFATACLMAGTLACASNSARVDDETAAAAQDTTSSTEAPPGYSGMEKDTTMAPDSAPSAVDTFLDQQGTGVPADTQGYGGFEQPDTTGGQDPAAQPAPTGYDTTTAQPGQTGYDTTGYGQQPSSDTTGMGTTPGLDSVPQ
jgi:hypothetical protein